MIWTNSLPFQDWGEVKHSWNTCIWNIRQHAVFLRVWIPIGYTSITTHFFTNKMALEPSKNKKENYWETKTLYFFFHNIPLIDIFPHVTLVSRCLIPSDESFISVTRQTLDQLDHCYQPAKKCFFFHRIVAFSSHLLLV